MLDATPLNETDYQRFDDFMLSDAAPDSGMCISMLDGYLTAVVSGPNTIMPAEWLRWVWDFENGEDAPAFKREEDASEILSLVMRHYQDVNATLMQAPHDYEPLILEREHEGSLIPIIDEWCMGYEKGIAIDRAAWAPLLVSQPTWFSTILLYGTETGWEVLDRKPHDPTEHQRMAGSLGDCARRIHAFWLEQRRAQAERGEKPGVKFRQQPVRNAMKIGRNDPCHCGSGRKYKHCHGAN